MKKVKSVFNLNKREAGCIFIFTAYFLVCLFLSISNYAKEKEQDTYNRARVLLKDELEEINAGNMDRINHEAFIFGLNGIITFSNSASYSIGQHINATKELQTDHAYSTQNSDKLKVAFPLIKDDSISHFVIFFIGKDEVKQNEFEQILFCFLPLCLWAMSVLLFFFFIFVYMNRKIIYPMKQISQSSEAIISGDYTKEIVQKRDREKPQGEVEKLIYSFEMMRDELREKSVREEQLKKSQRELMSCMSHDLRTPITTIQAHAEAIRDGIVKEEEKKQLYIATIIKKTEVLNRMIADLLDHSNAQLNQLKIEKEECYILKYLDELAKELQIYCKKSGCEFTYDVNIKEMLVNMDSGRITQVIYNLIENACKYMKQSDSKIDESKDSGKIPRISLNCRMEDEERKLYISVVDNGPGIEMVDIPYVFDRFYRAEKSRCMQIPGAGLGLSICRYIVEQHNGRIMLQSRKGEGTKVTFYLNY